MRQNTKVTKCKREKMQMGHNVNVSKFNCDKIQIQTIKITKMQIGLNAT